MLTEYNNELFRFPDVEKKAVVAGFDGGNITSDAGILLLGQADRAIRLTKRLAGCFPLQFPRLDSRTNKFST